ncbi:MAG: hypothetical protein U0556_12270 [Dehalococcoidia bacterium]
MRGLLLWIGLVLSTVATVGFAAGSMMQEVGNRQAAIDTYSPAGPSGFKVIETVTLGRSGFVPPSP